MSDGSPDEVPSGRPRPAAGAPGAVGFAVAIVDLAGRATCWNREAEEAFAWSGGGAASPFVDLVAAGGGEGGQGGARARLLEGSLWAGDVRVGGGDGSAFPATVTCAPVCDADGHVVATLVLAVPSSEPGDGSTPSRPVLRPPHVAVVLDADGSVVFASCAADALLGHRPADVLAGRWWDHIGDRDRAVVAEALARVEARQPSGPVRFRARHADGSERWLEVVGTCLDGDHGSLVAVLGWDVHEHEVAAQAARHAEAQLRAVSEAGPLAVAAFDLDGTCTAVHGDLFSLEGSELVVGERPEGRSDLGFDADGWRQRMLGGEPFSHEITCHGRVVRLHHVPIVDDGAVTGGVVVASEITTERRAEEALVQSEARFRALVQRSSDAALIVDPMMRITWASPAVEEIFGYDAGEVVGRSGTEFIHPDDLSWVTACYGEVLAGRPQPPFEMRIRASDGTWRWVEDQLTNLLDEPAVGGIVANLRDITGRRRASEALATSEQRYRTIVESAGEGICIYDEEGRVVLANARLARMLGVERVPERFMTCIHPHDLHIAQRGFERRKQGVGDSFELRLLRADGEAVHVLVTANPLLSPSGTFEGGVLMLADITDRKRAEEELARLALTDQLTGLPNRALILDRLQEALVRAERHGDRVAAMFLDLDQFKLVNDSFGHFVGDDLLRAVADRLTSSVRSGDTTIGRLGGDEFVVLCHGLAAETDAIAVADRLHDSLSPPFRVGDHELYVTASIGVALGPPGDPDALLSHADAAMYRAKQAGRARTELYDEDLRESARQRLQLLNELRTGIEGGQLLLEYQPVVDVVAGRVAGVEALVRWDHPTRGRIAPDSFIGAAEESGLIVEMGARVLGAALEQAARWDEVGLPLTMSVNLSARQLTDPSVVERVAAALGHSGFDPGRLCLEITESAVMEDVGAAVEVMRQLRRLGLRLAIDDFGTGYSSLTYLSRLPVDTLKIDRSFIAPLPDDGEAIVDAITRLARAVGVSVVAEGVETEGQAEAVRRLGCDQAQGYLWSPSVPAEQVPDVVGRLERRRATRPAPTSTRG